MLSRKFISKQRKMKKLLLLIIFLSCWTLLPAQLSYGTTGLLHAPSADMQKGQDRDAWRKLLASRAYASQV